MLDIDEYRSHTQNQLLILDNLKLSKISVDRITQFDIRPPELRQLFNKLGYYYSIFVISIKVNIGYFRDKIKSNSLWTLWVDGLQRYILVRKKDIPEIII